MVYPANTYAKLGDNKKVLHGDEQLYTVQQVAEIVGLTDGRLYQQIKDGVLRTASTEYLESVGLNPAVIRKPKHWITSQALHDFMSLPRHQYDPSKYNR